MPRAPAPRPARRGARAGGRGGGPGGRGAAARAPEVEVLARGIGTRRRLELARAALAAPELVHADVGQDPVQPRGYGPLGAVRPRAQVALEEGALHGIFTGGPRPPEAPRHPQQPPPIPPDQL